MDLYNINQSGDSLALALIAAYTACQPMTFIYCKSLFVAATAIRK